MKSFAAFWLFAIFAVAGTGVLGNLSDVLSTTQKIGYFFEIFGFGGMCISAGWILRSKQDDFISNNRNSQ